MKTADISMESVGGRILRVARWRLEMPSKHLPVLFFNGIGANIEAVAPLAEALDDRGFIMFDMPGVGESPEPLVPYNAFTMAWTTMLLLDRFGIDQVDVMGVSWGGAMAQHFALQHPARTRRLILVATSAGMIMVPGNPKALSKMANPRRYVDAAFMEKHFQTLYGGALGAASGKAGHIARLKPPTRRGYLYQLLAMIGWTSAPALPFLKALIPGSELEVMEGGGHLFLLSHRDQSVSAIRRFLDRPDANELPEAA